MFLKNNEINIRIQAKYLNKNYIKFKNSFSQIFVTFENVKMNQLKLSKACELSSKTKITEYLIFNNKLMN